jgi:ribosome-associated protein
VTATDRAKQMTIAAAEAASSKLADRIVAFDVSEQLVITDVFMVCSASNDRQVRAVVDAVEEKLHELEAKPTRREGHREGRWVLLDYVDIVVHVQHEDERSYYALDRIWADCPTIDLPESVAAGQPDGGGAGR